MSTLQNAIIEPGAIRQLDALLDRIKAEKLFFVVDKPAYDFSGAAETLDQCFKARTVTWFSDFELNPKIEDVERGKDIFVKNPPDAVIAFGGGSALDMGKLIASCSVQDAALIETATGKTPIKNMSAPLIAVPTTSGTGSEATHFAVVYVEGKKYSMAHEYLLPAHVIIDPELTYSLPPGPTAASGLDALCQSIESLWSVGADDDSTVLAGEALQLALANIERAVREPTPQSRANMSRAAHLAGKAINITKTTAPHALSYVITTKFNVPHGAAVALTLGSFLEFNFNVDETNCNDRRGPEEVRKRMNIILNAIGDGSMTKSLERLETLIRNIGCPARLAEAGISMDDAPSIAEGVNLERLSNNPRKISTDELHRMIQAVY